MKLSKSVLFLSVLILTGISHFACAQAQEKRIRGAVGKCEISRHITQEEAEMKALQNAKTDALRKAGVPEKLWTVTGLISQDDGSEFSQVLSRMTTLQVDGFINIRQVEYSEELSDGKRYAVATIDADVKRGGEIDPTFVLDVDQPQTIYKEGDRLTFKAKIYGHDAYSTCSGSTTTEVPSYSPIHTKPRSCSTRRPNTSSLPTRTWNTLWRR